MTQQLQTTELPEFRFSNGEIHWTAEGPGGKQWSIIWQPQRETNNIRAWPFPAGTTRHFSYARYYDDARREALRIARLIKAGKKG